MRFLVDAQLSPALATWLRARGHEAEHVAAVLGERAPDKAIVAYARQHAAIIVSKDSDFLPLLEALADPPRLLRVRLGNAVNRVLIARLEGAWPGIESALHAGLRVVDLD